MSYGEGFVTPRVFAEALGVASLCTALQRRWWLTAALLLMATVLHPLMGLALLAVIIWLLIENIPRYLVLSAFGLLVLAGLGLTGLAPFSWVWEQMETEWFAIVRAYNPIVLLSNWGANGFASTFLKLLILIIILKKDSDPRKRLAQAALVVTALFLALSFVFADLLGNRLFIGLQLWRVLFLFALLANVMAFHAVQCVPQGRGRQFLMLALVVNLLEMAFFMTPLFSGLLGVIAAVVLWVEDRKGPILALKYRLLSSVPIFVLLLAFAAALIQILISEPPEDLMPWLKTALCVGAVILILKGSAVTAIAGGFAAVALILGLITVDVRSDWTRFTETAHPPPEELSSLLEDKTVFWDSGLQVMWFSLRRPHFYSCRQKGGMVFYRDQAVEIIRRGMVLSALNSDEFPADQTSQCPQKQDKYATLPSGKATFERVCAALPELDLIVLRSRLPGLYRAVWVAPVTVGVPLADGTLKQAQTPFFFYQCADFRS
ncbi:hypothetical protein EI983_18780 [Roseovarius faecimaris]|uniref:Uncharacterized protein n=1 Tax=Roseovarius faecimaris TaxID=2494550 RepID=A0A6I6IXM0_9RHOB|nr:hypothetical protein [Roseovarius faecimaris]QGY00198.1 hypothetical protein EI983_18780 [Roseovarius faecimaris]